MTWAILKRSNSRLDGFREGIDHHNGIPHLFRTKKEAVAFIKGNYAYFKRADLRSEPHGWLMPIPVKIAIQRVI
jgi:hypothetical protein